MAGLPRAGVSTEGIYPGDIAAALMGLRLDRIVSVKWDIKPSVGIVAKDVDRLAMDIRSFKEPLTRVVKRVMIPSIKKNFDAGGRPAWEPLSEGTIKQRGYSAWPILVVKGLLKRRATQFNIWDIGMTSATIRRLPQDVYYGNFHQSGGEVQENGMGLVENLLRHGPGSAEAEKLIGKFIPRARKELGPDATDSHVHNRAIGMLLDADEHAWRLPARPFIMWQNEDVPKIEAIFYEWMEERAIAVGRFRPE
jgi:phage gpG-like protein